MARISGSSAGIGEQGREVGALLLLVAERPDRGDDRLELAELARQRRILGPADAFGEPAPISS